MSRALPSDFHEDAKIIEVDVRRAPASLQQITNERGERSLDIRGKGIQDLLRIGNERRQVDVIFGWEMVEDGAPRDPGTLRNVIDGDVVDRLFDR